MKNIIAVRRQSVILGILFSVTLFFSVATAKNPGRDTYRLGKNDVIGITILAGGEVEVEVSLVVSDQGTVNVPLVGATHIAGLTVKELEEKLHIPLARDFFVSPQIHIKVEEYHSLSYFIAGAVKEPGHYELHFEPSVLDLIVKAGGVEEGRGKIAYILKGDATIDIDQQELESAISARKPVQVDLVKLLDQGDMSENIKLSSGDTVYIPLGKELNAAISKIYVQGQVKAPGVFDFQPGMTALSACILAGGFDKYAAPGRTRIIRYQDNDSVTIKIDLDDVIKGDAQDMALQPGDRIHVPESWF